MSLATEVAGKLNYLNDKDKATVNALAPYSGYLSVQKKMDTFVFKEDAGFTYKVADRNRFLKFGDTVVDTYGPELVTKLESDGAVIVDNLNGSYTATTVSSSALASEQLSCVSGKVYRVICRVKSGTTGISVYIRNSSDSANVTSSIVYTSGKWEQVELVFKSSGNEIIRVYGNTSNSGFTAMYQTPSVREIQSMNFEECVPVVAEIIS